MKTNNKKPTGNELAAASGSDLNVGSILRIKWADRFRVYQVTGVHLGSVTEEDIISLRTLDLKDGHAYGKTVPELMVPLVMLLELSQNAAAQPTLTTTSTPE